MYHEGMPSGTFFRKGVIAKENGEPLVVTDLCVGAVDFELHF